MKLETVHYSVSYRVARIEMNRLERRNALEIIGVGTMYRYHRQVNALGGLHYQEPAKIVETEGRTE